MIKLFKNTFIAFLAFFAVTGSGLSFSAEVAITSECIKSVIVDEYYRIVLKEVTDQPDKKLNQVLKGFKFLKSVNGHSEIVPMVDSQRLINKIDWENAGQKLDKPRWLYYGETTIDDWLDTLEYVNKLNPETPIDVRLLHNIHKMAAKNHKFHGFEGRRIRKLLDDGKIDRDEFKRLLGKAYKENIEISGVDHTTLLGKFRSDSLDQIVHNGSSFDENGARYFTKRELDAIRKNTHMTVDETTIKQVGNDKFTGTAHYHDVNRIDETMNKVMAEVNKQLKNAKSQEEIIKIVIQMEKDLISIHPYLDGNGRTIRLFGDFILKKYNIPPSLYPNEEDLVMSLEEAYRFQIRGMQDYVKLKEHFIK